MVESARSPLWPGAPCQPWRRTPSPPSVEIRSDDGWDGGNGTENEGGSGSDGGDGDGDGVGVRSGRLKNEE